jgi:hypothetical protein
MGQDSFKHEACQNEFWGTLYVKNALYYVILADKMSVASPKQNYIVGANLGKIMCLQNLIKS